MTVVRHQLSLRNLPVQACDSRAQGFSPPLARRRSSYPPPSPNLVRTHPIEHYQPLRDSAPCLSRAATLPKGTKLGPGRGAHLGTPSSANYTAAASQPTGGIAQAASWLYIYVKSYVLSVRPNVYFLLSRFFFFSSPLTYKIHLHVHEYIYLSLVCDNKTNSSLLLLSAVNASLASM